MAYQQGRVGIREVDDRLAIHDLESGDEIAAHALHLGKGHTSRNENHYRDHRQQEADREQAIARCQGEPLGGQLCACLRESMPRHYREQLRGARKLLEDEPELDLTLIVRLGHPGAPHRRRTQGASGGGPAGQGTRAGS